MDPNWGPLCTRAFNRFGVHEEMVLNMHHLLVGGMHGGGRPQADPATPATGNGASGNDGGGGNAEGGGAKKRRRSNKKAADSQPAPKKPRTAAHKKIRGPASDSAPGAASPNTPGGAYSGPITFSYYTGPGAGA